MEVTVYNERGNIKTHHRGIYYQTRLNKLNASETDRIVLWDSTTSNIMSHGQVPSVRVSLRVDPPPGSTTGATMHTMGTFPVPTGNTFDAQMYAALHGGIQTWCNKHFGKLQIQPSTAMPPDSHVMRIVVKRVYGSTRTWAYDDEHEHGGYFRKDPERPNETSKHEGENDTDGVYAIVHLVAPCTHMILNQIMPGAAQHDLRPLQPPKTGDNDKDQAPTILAQQCAARVAYNTSPRQVMDDAGATPDDLSDSRSDMQAIREFLLTPRLAIQTAA